MTAVLEDATFAVTADELAAMYLRLGIAGPVAPLGLRSGHTAVDARDAAMSRAADDLTARGLIVDGIIEPDVASVLHALHRPDREVAMRFVGPADPIRISVVRRGPLTVLARRAQGRLVIRMLPTAPKFADVVVALRGELPAMPPSAVEPIDGPLAEVAECLTGSVDPRSLTDRIRAVGASQRAAASMGAALGARLGLVEVTYSALHDHDGRILRAPAAAVVFYTGRGRVIAVPSRSPAGQPWTTLKPGSDQVFGQALTQLVELSTEGWGSDSDT